MMFPRFYFPFYRDLNRFPPPFASHNHVEVNKDSNFYNSSCKNNDLSTTPLNTNISSNKKNFPLSFIDNLSNDDFLILLLILFLLLENCSDYYLLLSLFLLLLD